MVGCDREARAGRRRCRLCNLDGSTPRLAPLPAEPLVLLVEARGGVARCNAPAAARRAYVRAKSTGALTVWSADVLAHVLLGAHPWEVWPAWFEISPDGSDSSSHEHETVDV